MGTLIQYGLFARYKNIRHGILSVSKKGGTDSCVFIINFENKYFWQLPFYFVLQHAFMLFIIKPINPRPFSGSPRQRKLFMQMKTKNTQIPYPPKIHIMI